MTTANQPESQKPQDSLSDLGQITQTKAMHIRAALKAECFDVHQAYGYLSAIVANLTSASKADREFAKKEVRRLAKKGAEL